MRLVGGVLHASGFLEIFHGGFWRRACLSIKIFTVPVKRQLLHVDNWVTEAFWKLVLALEESTMFLFILTVRLTTSLCEVVVEAMRRATSTYIFFVGLVASSLLTCVSGKAQFRFEGYLNFVLKPRGYRSAFLGIT